MEVYLNAGFQKALLNVNFVTLSTMCEVSLVLYKISFFLVGKQVIFLRGKEFCANWPKQNNESVHM